MKLLYFWAVLSLLLLSESSAQVNFGSSGGGRRRGNGGINRGGGGSLTKVEFAADGGATNNDDDDDAPVDTTGLNIKNALGSRAPDVETRFFFQQQQSGRTSEGNSCRTPRGRAGTCSFISDSRCSRVARRIRRQGFNENLVQDLLQRIRSPCGFVPARFDFTLCCRNRGGGNNGGGGGNNGGGNNGGGGGNNGGGGGNNGGGSGNVNQCGTVSTQVRIIGGQEAQQGAWPWAAILGSPSGSNGFRVVCGGSLIDRNHVLTAAHCFPNGRNSRITHVRLGEHDISQTNDGRHLDVPVRSVRVHEQFSNFSLKNDLAIVTLNTNVRFTSRIKPICLPRSVNGLINPVIIGWGSTIVGGPTTNALMQARINLVGVNRCNRAYDNIPRITIGNDQLCAGNGTTDTCTGDSGGPLMLQDRNSDAWYVAGITSFGVECANRVPGVYTRVSAFFNWISRNT